MLKTYVSLYHPPYPIHRQFSWSPEYLGCPRFLPYFYQPGLSRRYLMWPAEIAFNWSLLSLDHLQCILLPVARIILET